MNSLTLSDEKAALRKRAKAELKNYFSDKALARQCAESVAEAFFKTDEYKNSPLILAYMAMPDEISLEAVILQALKDGKKVALPRMYPCSNEMDFFYINSMDENFTSDNKYGIQEPSVDLEKVIPSEIPENSVFMVPGLAFNLEGARLGRGKGFYDRYLSSLPVKGAVFCGVCTVNVITKAIPCAENDVKMTCLLNEYGFVRC